MLNAIYRRLRSDRGDSELVSLLILLPLVVGILFTTIDAAIYFTNRSTMQSVARDGARSVAIFGGKGNSNAGTPIEKQYGQSKSIACEKALPGNMGTLGSYKSVATAYNASAGTITPVECNLLRSIAEADKHALINVTVTGVSCNPTSTVAISERTSCSVSWKYGNIPGSALVLFNKDGKQGKNAFAGGNTTVGTSEAEVNMNGISLVSR